MFPIFADLQITRVIAHEVFQRDETHAEPPPRLSQTVVPLDESATSTFRKRLVDALGKDSHSIEMSIVEANDTSTFSYATRLLDADDEQFVRISRNIARNLSRAQISRAIPGGVVAIFQGTTSINRLRYSAIVKAETQDGFVKSVSDAGVLLKRISDVLLTPHQRLYKIGIFVEQTQPPEAHASRNPNDFAVFVYDHQLRRATNQGASKYFYESFLGCHIHPSSRKLTTDFYQNARFFINNMDISSEDRIEIQNSLHVYLKASNQSTVNCREFADYHLPSEFVDPFLTHMEENKIPATDINKDISDIKNKLRVHRIRFDSKVEIRAPSTGPDSLVKVIDYSENKTTVRIEGRIIGED